MLLIVFETLLNKLVDSEIILEIRIHVMYPAEKKGIKTFKSRPHSLEPIIPNATTNIPILKEAHIGPKILFEYLVLISENARK